MPDSNQMLTNSDEAQKLSDNDRALRHRASLASIALEAGTVHSSGRQPQKQLSRHRAPAPSQGGDMDMFLQDMRRWMSETIMSNDSGNPAQPMHHSGGGQVNWLTLKRDLQLRRYRDMPDVPESRGPSPTSSMVYLDKLRKESPLSPRPRERFEFENVDAASSHRSGRSSRRYSTQSPPDARHHRSPRCISSTGDNASHLVSPDQNYERVFKTANGRHLDSVLSRRREHPSGASSISSRWISSGPAAAADAADARYSRRDRSDRYGYPSRDFDRQQVSSSHRSDRHRFEARSSSSSMPCRRYNAMEQQPAEAAYSEDENDDVSESGSGEDEVSEDDITEEDACRLEEYLMLRRLRQRQKRLRRRQSPPQTRSVAASADSSSAYVSASRPRQPAEFLWQLNSPTVDYLRQPVSSRSPSPPLMPQQAARSHARGEQDVFRKPTNPPPRSSPAAAACRPGVGATAASAGSLKRSCSPEPPKSLVKQNRYY